MLQPQTLLLLPILNSCFEQLSILASPSSYSTVLLCWAELGLQLQHVPLGHLDGASHHCFCSSSTKLRATFSIAGCLEVWYWGYIMVLEI